MQQTKRPITKSSWETNNKKEIFCPKCQDRGIILIDSLHAKTCACVQQRKFKQKLNSSRFSRELLQKTFASFETRGNAKLIEIKQKAQAFVESFKPTQEINSIGIMGPVGTGKTHLCCAISNALMDKGHQVYYFNFIEGFQEMFSFYSKEASELEAVRKELLDAEILFIDDLFKGIEKFDLTKGVYKELYSIINHRYVQGLPIIWNSEFKSRLLTVDEGLTSRILEKSYTLQFGDSQASGSNQRLKRFAERQGFQEE